VLTGANNDGAQGLRAIMLAGGTAIVESPELAFAGAMPQAALQSCPGASAWSLEDIADYLKAVVRP
jgi:two-component system chemotaxis response regulator CheB